MIDKTDKRLRATWWVYFCGGEAKEMSLPFFYDVMVFEKLESMLYLEVDI